MWINNNICLFHKYPLLFWVLKNKNKKKLVNKLSSNAVAFGCEYVLDIVCGQQFSIFKLNVWYARTSLCYFFRALSIRWPPIDSRFMQIVEIDVGLFLITITNTAFAVTSVYVYMLALFSLWIVSLISQLGIPTAVCAHWPMVWEGILYRARPNLRQI